MQLSRALSDLVKYTKSVGAHDVDAEGEGAETRGRGGARLPRGPLTPASVPTVACSWQVSSFSETKAQQTLQQKPAQYLRFNQRQLSRVYPSSYRVDSSNCNPQPFWNAGCQMGGRPGPAGRGRWGFEDLHGVLPAGPGWGPSSLGAWGSAGQSPGDRWPGGTALPVHTGEPWPCSRR